jgi:hypothetical protein
MKIAELLTGRVEALYFMEAAGVPSSFFMGDPKYAEGNIPTELISSASHEHKVTTYNVPLFRDPASACKRGKLDDKNIQSFVPIDKGMVPHGSALIAVRAKGDSMAPILRDNYIVVVDTAQRDLEKLVGEMVLTCDRTDATFRWLRKIPPNESNHSFDFYILVPEKISNSCQVSFFNEQFGSEIVGAVVLWIGMPSSKKRK